MSRIALPAAALAVCAVALLHGDRTPAGALELSAARGAVAIVNSRAGQAIVVARNMAPGDVRRGEVTIANRGTRAVRLRVVGDGLEGALAARLTLRLDDGRRELAVAGCHDLGVLSAGEVRRFELRALFAHGGGDNDYAGASARVNLRWAAGNCAPAAHVEPRLVIASARARVIHRRARLRVRCVGSSGARCDGRVVLRARTRSTASSAARVRVAAKRTSTVSLRVPARLRKRLARRARVRAYAAIEPGGGGRRVTLVRPRRARR